MPRRSFEFGFGTDPHQVELALRLFGEIFEPKASRRARQATELLKQVAEFRRTLGYQPEFERQYVSQALYEPGAIRALFRPSERYPEPLLMQPKEIVSTTGRKATIYEPITLPPPHVEPIIKPEERAEVEKYAKEFFGDNPEAQRTFMQSYVYSRTIGTAPLQEFIRNNAIGLVTMEMDKVRDWLKTAPVSPTALAPREGETPQQAEERYVREEVRRRMPDAYAIWEDFYLNKEIERENKLSLIKSREERDKIAWARQRLAEWTSKWKEAHDAQRIALQRQAMQTRDKARLQALAFKAWQTDMNFLANRAKEQDRISMELFKSRYIDSPVFNAYDYTPSISPFGDVHMTFDQWLHSPMGEYWRQLGVGSTGELQSTTPTPPTAKGRTPPTKDRPPMSEAEQRLRQKYGF